jgi:hypothetical protein
MFNAPAYTSRMLSPKEIAQIRAEIERLETAHKECTDQGIQRWITERIEEQKNKLSGRGRRAS